MMKKYVIFIALIAVVLMTACQSKKTEEKHNPKFDNYAEIEGKADTTFYVVVNDVNEDSVDVTLLETGREYSLGLAPAQLNNSIIGTMNVNDTIAIMPDFKSKTVLSSINISCFYGLWFFKDKDGEGLRLNPDGTAVSIGWENSDLTLRHWRIYNGKLYLYTIPSDGSSYEELPFDCNVETITEDRLVFVLQGDRYDCYKSKDDLIVKVNK